MRLQVLQTFNSSVPLRLPLAVAFAGDHSLAIFEQNFGREHQSLCSDRLPTLWLKDSHTVRVRLVRYLKVRAHLVVSATLDDHLFLRLLVDLLRVASNEQHERAQHLLENCVNSAHSSRFVDCTHHSFEDVTQNLRCLKWLYLSLIQVEILAIGKLQVIVDVL